MDGNLGFWAKIATGKERSEVRINLPGEVAERLNAADSKSVLGSNLTGVRIPPSPLNYKAFSHLAKMFASTDKPVF